MKSYTIELVQGYSGTDRSEDFAATLARLRAAAGLSRYKLAQLSGVSAVHLGRLEAGTQQPGLAVIRKLAKALGVGLDALC